MASRVELTLPFQATQSSLGEERNRIKTVVADDSDTFLELACHILKQEDELDVIAAASDGIEAIDAVSRLKPALLIMDVYMPGLDGLCTASLVSAMSPAPIVVLMSSEDSPRLREACARAGAFAFVPKMTFQHDLPGLVDRIIEMRDERWARESA